MMGMTRHLLIKSYAVYFLDLAYDYGRLTRFPRSGMEFDTRLGGHAFQSSREGSFP